MRNPMFKLIGCFQARYVLYIAYQDPLPSDESKSA